MLSAAFYIPSGMYRPVEKLNFAKDVELKKIYLVVYELSGDDIKIRKAEETGCNIDMFVRLVHTKDDAEKEVTRTEILTAAKKAYPEIFWALLTIYRFHVDLEL
jgi:hypothetical protein